MARTPANFKQTDMVRAVKAALAAGLDIVRTEVLPDGTIRLIHSDCSPVPVSDFDRFEKEL